MRAEIDRCGDVLIVTVAAARLDASNTGSLKKRVAMPMSRHARAVVDLSQVEFLDSSGIGTLVLLRKRQEAREGSLHLVGLAEPLQNALDKLGLRTLLPDFETIEDAIAAFER